MPSWKFNSLNSSRGLGGQNYFRTILLPHAISSGRQHFRVWGCICSECCWASGYKVGLMRTRTLDRIKIYKNCRMIVRYFKLVRIRSSKTTLYPKAQISWNFTSHIKVGRCFNIISEILIHVPPKLSHKEQMWDYINKHDKKRKRKKKNKQKNPQTLLCKSYTSVSNQINTCEK